MSVWDRIRVWLKISVLSAVALYLLIFFLKNTGDGRQVTLWVWFNKTPTAPVLVVLPVTFFIGVLTTLLVRTIFRTLRQVREMKRRKLEKEAAAIISRAAKLRVREQQNAAGGVGGGGGRGFPIEPADEEPLP